MAIERSANLSDEVSEGWSSVAVTMLEFNSKNINVNLKLRHFHWGILKPSRRKRWSHICGGCSRIPICCTTGSEAVRHRPPID